MTRKTVFIGDRSAGRDNHFNLIRMIAATGVLVSHAYPIALGAGAVQPLQPWLKGITLGTVSVYVFFAISGFFITKSFDRSPSLGRFLRARLLRLYPALVLVLAVTVLIAGLFLTTASPGTFWAAGPGYMIKNLSLYRLQYELPGVFETNPYGGAINGSLWTLFYEVMCYSAVFLAGVIGLLRARRALAVALAGFVALQVAAPGLALPEKLVTLLDLAFPFAIGTAFYLWRDHVPLRLSLGLGLAGAAALAWMTPLFGLVFVPALSYWVFLIGMAPAPRALAYNRLGDYSYGTYIYAFPVQQLMAWFGVTTALGNMTLALPVTLICAVLSWHLVEKPALGWVHRPTARDQRA